MPTITNTNESDAYISLRNLEKYLNTDVGITCGTIERVVRKSSGGREPVLTDEYNIKATIRNTAPTEPDYPMIVFMGVVSFTRHGFGLREPVAS